MNDKTEVNFWTKVRSSKHGCWEWCASLRGGSHGNRYGNFRSSGKSEYSHRLSWAMHFGDIPDGMHVLHKCDNRKCVRPDHMFLGTQSDNLQDCYQKGRFPRTGNFIPVSEQSVVSEMLRNCSLASIARRYCVTPSTVRYYIRKHGLDVDGRLEANAAAAHASDRAQ